jgi:hypothetical protein
MNKYTFDNFKEMESIINNNINLGIHNILKTIYETTIEIYINKKIKKENITKMDVIRLLQTHNIRVPYHIIKKED